MVHLGELRRVGRDDHRLARTLRRLRLGRHVHPVIERLGGDRVARDRGDRIGRYTVAAATAATARRQQHGNGHDGAQRKNFSHGLVHDDG